MRKLLLVSLLTLAACATTSNQLSPEGQAALDISVRIAVRHALDSPRAQAKAANIRSIVTRLQAVTTAETTLGALENEVKVEIDKLNLSPIDKADALDLLRLLSVSLEARLGPSELQGAGFIQVNDFLKLVLAALPA